MQVFQPLEPEDYALVKGLTPKKENAAKFCSQYVQYETTCRRESWALFREELKRPEGALDFCSYALTENEKRRCISTVMSSNTWLFTIKYENINMLYDYCKGLGGREVEWCFAAAAERMINIDPRYGGKAVEICNLSKNEKVDSQCYSSIASYASHGYRPGSAEFISFCNMLPKDWMNICLKGEPYSPSFK
jgi:hypothetical protein